MLASCQHAKTASLSWFSRLEYIYADVILVNDVIMLQKGPQKGRFKENPPHITLLKVGEISSNPP